MSRFSSVLRWGVATVAFFVLPAAAHAEGAADPGRVAVELNKLEDHDGACRAYMVFGNGTDRSFDDFRLDLVLFRPDGVIARRLAVDAAPLTAGRTVVKLFDVTGLGCADIGRVLINDVPVCRDGTSVAVDCVSLVVPSSLAAAPLIK